MPRKRHPRPTADTTTDSADGDSDSGIRHPQRNAANARERARMRVLSRAFCRLKTTLPWVPPDTKLSKLDTLRFATGYIAHLRAVLTDQPFTNETGMGQKHPITLTWPFSFQQTGGTMPSNCESGCWNTSSRDSEDDDYEHSATNPSNTNAITNGAAVLREYPPYYQQFTDSLMHIG